MNRNIKWLSGLLAAQLLLALALSVTTTKLSAKNTALPLLAADKEQIDRLTIEGPDKAKVVLTRQAGTWRLSDEGGFPADAAKVKQVLDRLSGVRLSVPVASSSGSQERFKVSDGVFERRVTLGNGDKALATIYLGTSPGVHQIYVRRGDQKDVFTVDLAAYELPVKPEEWEDKTVLQFAKDDVQSIQLSGLTIDRSLESRVNSVLQNVVPQTAVPDADKNKAPDWHADGLASDESLKADGIDRLASLLSNLTIGSVLGRDEKPDYGLTQPALVVTVVRKNGDQAEYRLGKMTDGAYVLKVSNRAEYFRLLSYMGQNLLDAAKREVLVESKTAATAPAAPNKPTGK